jgi:hypothetical protein
MRRCNKCQKEKLDSDFYKASRDRGLMGLCKLCLKGYVKGRARKNKERAIVLLGGKCSRCGYSKCIGALEFHHTDPQDKLCDVRDLKFHGWSRFWAEAQKCVLFCANCHREEEEKIFSAPLAELADA